MYLYILHGLWNPGVQSPFIIKSVTNEIVMKWIRMGLLDCVCPEDTLMPPTKLPSVMFVYMQ